MLNRLSLRTRISLLVLGAVVPLAAVGLLAAGFLYQTYTESNEVRLVRLARSLSNATEARLASVIGAAEVLALSTALRSKDFVIFRERAEEYLQKYLPGSTLVVTDRAGEQKVNTALPVNAPLPNLIATSQIKRLHQLVLDKLQPGVSGVFVGQVLKEPRIAILVPVFFDGEPLYSLGITLHPELLKDVISRAQLPGDWTVAIFDQAGSTVARYPAPQDLGQSASPTLLPALEQKRDQFRETITHEGERVATAIAYSDQIGWSVALGVPSRSIETPFRMAILAIFLIGGASLLLALFAAIRLARSVLVADRHRDLLVNELNHRVKNTLSSLQSMISQTMRFSPTKEAANKSLEGRVIALARTHDLLTESNWSGSSARAVIRNALAPYSMRPNSIQMSGPDTMLTPNVALSLAMVLNELATNAVKYGALSTDSGAVDVRWLTDGGRLHLTWQESGGPAVIAPSVRGFGSRLIEQSVSGDLQARLEFVPSGVRCDITCSIAAK